MTVERRVRLIQDSDAFNPRTNDISRMVCWHNGYNLGDDHRYEQEGFLRELACEADDDLEEELDYLEDEVYGRLWDRAGKNGCIGVEQYTAYAMRYTQPRVDARIEAALSSYVILPLFLYDHSGITMSTSPFNCGWDSGQVGWIVCDQATIDKEFDGDRDKAKKCLEAEVSVYDDYISGNVWGYIAEERVDGEWEEVDSCWGFYGDDVEDNGMKCNLSPEFHEALADASCEYV